MPISLHGLDTSFLKENPLPEDMKARPRCHQPDVSKRSHLPSPYFMADITPFESVVSEKPEVISSRPQLREHEKRHNCYQTGNDFPVGAVGEKNEAKKAKLVERAKGMTVEWV